MTWCPGCQRNRICSEYTDFLKSGHITGKFIFAQKKGEQDTGGRVPSQTGKTHSRTVLADTYLVRGRVRKHRLECLSLVFQVNVLTYLSLSPQNGLRFFLFSFVHNCMEREYFCDFKIVHWSEGPAALLCFHLNQASSTNAHSEIVYIDSASKHDQ